MKSRTGGDWCGLERGLFKPLHRFPSLCRLAKAKCETGSDGDAAAKTAGISADLGENRPLAIFCNDRDIHDRVGGNLGGVPVAASKCASGEEHYGEGCGGAQGFHFQSHSVQVFSDGVKLRWPVGMLTEWAVHLPFRFASRSSC